MISIFFWKRGRITTFRSKFLSHSTEKFCWGTIQCIRKFRLSRNFFPWEGDTTILCWKFQSHSTEKLRRRPLLCFNKFLVSKILMHRGGGGGGGTMVLPKIFCLTTRKNFVRGLFCFTKFLVSTKFLEKRGRGYHHFLWQVFCLPVPKVFVGESFSDSLNSGIKKC